MLNYASPIRGCQQELSDCLARLADLVVAAHAACRPYMESSQLAQSRTLGMVHDAADPLTQPSNVLVRR